MSEKTKNNILGAFLTVLAFTFVILWGWYCISYNRAHAALSMNSYVAGNSSEFSSKCSDTRVKIGTIITATTSTVTRFFVKDSSTTCKESGAVSSGVGTHGNEYHTTSFVSQTTATGCIYGRDADGNEICTSRIELTDDGPVFSNSTDSTKRFGFDLSGLSTGVIVTHTMTANGLQSRVVGTCPVGSVKEIYSDGTVTCNLVSSGVGTHGNEYHSTEFQSRVTGTCSSGAITQITSTGMVLCTNLATLPSCTDGIYGVDSAGSITCIYYLSFDDSTYQFTNATNTTARMRFDLTGVTAGTQVTITVTDSGISAGTATNISFGYTNAGFQYDNAITCSALTCTVPNNIASFYTDATYTMLISVPVDTATLFFTAGSYNYVIATYASGSASFSVETTDTANYYNILPYAESYVNTGSTNAHVQLHPQRSNAEISLLHQRQSEVDRYGRVPGSLESMTITAGTNSYNLSGGYVWADTHKYQIAAVSDATPTATRLFRCIHDFGGDWSCPSTLNANLEVTLIDSATGTVTMAAGSYKKTFVYRGIESADHLYTTYSTATWATTDLARADNTRPVPPPLISSHALYVGYIISLKSATSGHLVYMASDETTGASTPVTAHSALTGLSGDDHTQYHNDTRADTWLAAKTETYTAGTLTVLYGTLELGTAESTSAVGGGFVEIQEASGTNALIATLGYHGITDTPTQVQIYGRYLGGSTHNVGVYAYNNTLSSWYQLGLMSSTTDTIWYVYPLYGGTDYVSGGTASLRFRHEQNGVASHDLFLDYVVFRKTLSEGSGGVTDHGALTGLQDWDHYALSIINEASGGVSATTVQGAINELDSEKDTHAAVISAIADSVASHVSGSNHISYANVHTATSGSYVSKSTTTGCIFGNNESGTEGCYQNVSFDDSAPVIYNSTDVTKRVGFDLSGITTASTVTVSIGNTGLASNYSVTSTHGAADTGVHSVATSTIASFNSVTIISANSIATHIAGSTHGGGPGGGITSNGTSMDMGIATFVGTTGAFVQSPTSGPMVVDNKLTLMDSTAFSTSSNSYGAQIYSMAVGTWPVGATGIKSGSRHHLISRGTDSVNNFMQYAIWDRQWNYCYHTVGGSGFNCMQSTVTNMNIATSLSNSNAVASIQTPYHKIHKLLMTTSSTNTSLIGWQWTHNASAYWTRGAESGVGGFNIYAQFSPHTAATTTGGEFWFGLTDKPSTWITNTWFGYSGGTETVWSIASFTNTMGWIARKNYGVMSFCVNTSAGMSPVCQNCPVSFPAHTYGVMYRATISQASGSIQPLFASLERIDTAVSSMCTVSVDWGKTNSVVSHLTALKPGFGVANGGVAVSMQGGFINYYEDVAMSPMQ